MGVGKTTIGKELARKLQRGFIDVDAEIVEKYGMEPVDIFKVHGEKAFRKTEEQMTIHFSQLENKVISVGGGAFMNDAIRTACIKNTIVIFLDISWDHWVNRLSILLPTRPVLQGKDLHEIKQLFDDRQAIYQDYQLRILINQLGVDQAVEAIVEELKLLD